MPTSSAGFFLKTSQFGLGQRGPDVMRHQALVEIAQRNDFDAGPHRFYSQGKWTDFKLFAPEIVFEARKIVPGEAEPLGTP